MNLRVRIERLELRGQRRHGLRLGEVGLGDHQTVGEDRLLARLRGPVEIFRAAHGVDDGEHHLDRELAAERAVGREGLQDRADVGEPAGLDQHAAEVRDLAAVAVGDELAQRDLQIRTGVAAQAAVAEQRHLVLRRAQQRVVDADRAELVDDQRGAAALRRIEEAAHQRGLSRAEEAGDDRDRQPGAARALLPPAERAGGSGGEERLDVGHAHRWSRLLRSSPSPAGGGSARGARRGGVVLQTPCVPDGSGVGLPRAIESRISGFKDTGRVLAEIVVPEAQNPIAFRFQPPCALCVARSVGCVCVMRSVDFDDLP